MLVGQLFISASLVQEGDVSDESEFEPFNTPSKY
jgi:hypothetical protein